MLSCPYYMAVNRDGLRRIFGPAIEKYVHKKLIALHTKFALSVLCCLGSYANGNIWVES
jgi:hypothetical protein